MKKSLVLLGLAGAMAFSAAQAETVLYGSIRLGTEIGKNHYGERTVWQKAGYNESGELNAGSNPWGYKGYNYRQQSVRNKRGMSMQDFGSRLGLKGGEDLGNGNKVLFQLEWGFDGMSGDSFGEGFENRLAWIGLSGDWGTLAIGRQNNPFTEALNTNTEADDFNGNYVSALRYATGGVAFAGPGQAVRSSPYDAKAYMPNRVGNSIAYVSPTWGGFNFVVAGIADAPDYGDVHTDGIYNGNGAYNSAYNSNKTFDIYTVSLNYEHESGFFAKAAYLGSDLYKDAKRANVYGLNLGFKNEQWGINADVAGGSRSMKHTGYSEFGSDGLYRGGSFADYATPDYTYGIDNENRNKNTKISSLGWDVGAHFSFGPDYFSTIRATYGQSKIDYKPTWGGKGQDKMAVWAVGFEQKLSNRTRVWVEYAKEDNKVRQTDYTPYRSFNNSAPTRKKFNDDVVSIGIRHDF